MNQPSRNTLIRSVVITLCMKVLIVIAPEKFRDEEFTVPAAALQKAGIGYAIATTRRGLCTGMLGAKINATLSFEEVDPKSYDGLLIVGGSGAQTYLWGDKLLGQMVKFFHSTDRVVGAICLAPVVLARAGILKGKKATVFNSPDSFREMKAGGAVLVDKAVAGDGRIITANGPAAAREFADTFILTLAAAKG
jgi:protease I